MNTIGKLRLSGLLSFAPSTPAFDLHGLNVLIGPNGSGKSNLIEVLELLSAVPHDLAAAVRTGGLPDEWLWRGTDSLDHAEVDIELNECTLTGRPLRYRLRFAPVQSRLEVVDEAIEEVEPQPGNDDVYFYYRFQHGHPVLNLKDGQGSYFVRRLKREDLSPDQSVLSQRKDPEQYPEVTWMGRRLSAIRTFRIGPSDGMPDSGGRSRRICLTINCCRTAAIWPWW